jgi:hypothetical protein
LVPFSLWHRELLRLAGHPLLAEEPMDFAQLELAVRLCSVPGSQAGKVLRQKATWWRRWSFALRAVWWSRKLPAEEAAFQAYLNACCTMPDVMATGGEPGKQRVTPGLLTVLSYLSSQGFDSKVVGSEWPAGLVDWMYLTSLSASADVKFLTDEDREFQEGLRAMRAMQEQREREKRQREREEGRPRAVRLLREALGRE